MNAAAHRQRQDGSSGWWAVREVDHLFSRFARYTRFVVYSKWSLVAVALLLLASLIIWPLVTKDTSGLRVSFVDSKTVAQQPSSPVMNNPEFNGTGTSGQQYKVIGKTATQKTPSMVVIDAVQAQLTKANGDLFSLTAERADYAQDKKIIDLFGNVTVVDAKATNFVTSRATIETDTMHIYGNEQITGEGSFGKLVASGFEIRENGNHIIFTRGAEQLRVTVDRAKRK